MLLFNRTHQHKPTFSPTKLSRFSTPGWSQVQAKVMYSGSGPHWLPQYGCIKDYVPARPSSRGWCWSWSKWLGLPLANQPQGSPCPLQSRSGSPGSAEPPWGQRQGWLGAVGQWGRGRLPHTWWSPTSSEPDVIGFPGAAVAWGFPQIDRNKGNKAHGFILIMTHDIIKSFFILKVCN